MVIFPWQPYSEWATIVSCVLGNCWLCGRAIFSAAREKVLSGSQLQRGIVVTSFRNQSRLKSLLVSSGYLAWHDGSETSSTAHTSTYLSIESATAFRKRFEALCVCFNKVSHLGFCSYSLRRGTPRLISKSLAWWRKKYCKVDGPV